MFERVQNTKKLSTMHSSSNVLKRLPDALFNSVSSFSLTVCWRKHACWQLIIDSRSL